MPGPPRKSQRLKVLEGTFRKDLAPKPGPPPVTGRPVMPAGLGRVAKAEWRRICPILQAMGILAVSDRATIAAYCQAWQRWLEFEAAVSEHGATFTTDTGYIAQRPEIAMAHKQATLLRALSTELGLTPAARTRIQLPEKVPPKDQTEEMLFGHRRGA